MVNIRFSYCSMNQTEAQALPNKTSAQMRNVSFQSNHNTSTREVKISTHSHFPRTPLNISLNESKISALVNIFPLKTNLNEPNLDIACGKSVCVKINKHSWRQWSILIPSRHLNRSGNATKRSLRRSTAKTTTNASRQPHVRTMPRERSRVWPLDWHATGRARWTIESSHWNPEWAMTQIRSFTKPSEQVHDADRKVQQHLTGNLSGGGPFAN